MIKIHIQKALAAAIASLQQQQVIPSDISIVVQVERSRDEKNGDFSSNIAMLLAKTLKINPRELAQKIISAIPTNEVWTKIEMAGPGFINFFCRPADFQSVVGDILLQRERYGRQPVDPTQKVHIEFVSSNPTGPLHVGHGRGAAYGASLANIFAAAGYAVHREYYLNDAGRQMDILTVSIWLRYLNLLGVTSAFPPNAYQGHYITTLALKLQSKAGKSLTPNISALFERESAPTSPSQFTEPVDEAEKRMDGIITNVKLLLGAHYQTVLQLGLESIVADMKEDLAEFRVVYDEWFSEQSLITSGASDRAFALLEKKGLLYAKEGGTLVSQHSIWR